MNATAQPPPTDPWAPGVRAADVPVAEGGELIRLRIPLMNSKRRPRRCARTRPTSSGTFTSCSRQRSCSRIPMRGSRLRMAIPRLAESPTKPNNFPHSTSRALPNSRREKNKAGFNVYVGAALTAGRDRQQSQKAGRVTRTS